jgi:hypothetical protein
LLALAGCGGGDGGGGGGGGGSSNDEAQVDIGVMDAPVSQLAAFSATLDELHLVHEDGTETSNLLAEPIEVEFLGLAGSFVWLASTGIATGTYVGARIGFVEDSAHAVAEDGSASAVHALSDDLTITFASPLVLAKTDYRSLVIDLDLAESLQRAEQSSTPPGSTTLAPGDAEGSASVPLVFQPQGTSSTDDGTLVLAIDSFRGRVIEVNPSAAHLKIDAFTGETSQISLGQVDVSVPAPAFLLAEDGTTQTAEEFFASLLATKTMIDVHGMLVGGGVQAHQIEVVDLDGDGQVSLPVRIEGLVLAHELNTGFQLLLMEVEKGSDLVDPVLAGLGDPTSFQVVYDASTLFLAADAGGTTTPEALAPGQRVDVEFAQFLSLPFQAARVELVDAHPRADGFIKDTTGMPQEFVMHVLPGEAVIGNQIATGDTDVLVHLDGAPIVLQTTGEPTLTAEQLQNGQAIEFEGAISGPTDAPEVAATEIDVRPGRLQDAVVTFVDPIGSTFLIEGGTVMDPFGGVVNLGPTKIAFDPRVVVEEDATSIEEFFALFNGLQGTQTLHVEIEGIGAVAPNTILAFEVEAHVVE